MKKDWTYKKLNELGFVGRGKSKHRPRNEPSLYGGNYPFIQTGDVKAAELYISEHNQTYNEKGLSQSKLWKKNTLLITIAANIAETAILKIDACFPDSIVGFIADPLKADVRFIKYYIDTIKIQMQSISRGTTQDNLSVDKLLSFDILTPPLPTQQKIAAILSNYDDLIENNTRRIKILEEMAQTLYHEWFVKFRFPGHEQVKMVESELGLIPEGWEVRKLGELGLLARGKSKHRPRNDASLYGGNYPFIQTGEVKEASLYITNYNQTYNDKGLAQSKLWESGTLLITIAANIAETAIITFSSCFPDSIVGFVADSSKVSTEFIKYSIDAIKLRMQNVSKGTTQDNLSLEKIKIFNFLLPDKETMQLFGEITTPIFSQIQRLLIKNQNLRATRDLLLPKLISGEIDVEKLEIDTGNIAA